MTERYINPHTDFGFTRLFEQAEISKFNQQELKSYEDSVNAYRDIVNAIKTAEKKKYAEGKAEGMTTKAVGDITGLTEEEITSLND